MQEWLRQNPRTWDLISEGCTCEQAVWETLVAYDADGDVNDQTSIATITVVMDLVKAFERVQLWQVWRWGMYYNFPPELLAMVLTYFSYARRLQVMGSFTEQLQTWTAIVAGSKFSVAILRLVLMWPMDQLLDMWPSLSLK
eukprot:6113658-Karenia_brevis.AAC.1